MSDFEVENNLYSYIYQQPYGSSANRFQFSSAKVIQDWLTWIAQRNEFSPENSLLIEKLIKAAELDFTIPDKLYKEWLKKEGIYMENLHK